MPFGLAFAAIDLFSFTRCARGFVDFPALRYLHPTSAHPALELGIEDRLRILIATEKAISSCLHMPQSELDSA